LARLSIVCSSFHDLWLVFMAFVGFYDLHVLQEIAS